MHNSPVRRRALRAALLGVAAATAAGLSASTYAAILYNPVVTMVGDGTPIVSGNGRTTTTRIYANTTPAQASPLSELAYNSGSTGVRLIESDSATSEGLLNNNPAIIDKAAVGLPFSGNAYVFNAGYDAANNTAAVIGTAANANRVVGYMNVNSSVLSGATTPVSQTQATAYDNNNYRSAVGNDTVTDVWSGGTGATTSTAGWRHFSSNTQLSTSNSTNVRDIEIHNGQLFGSTGAGTQPGRGIYAIGTGTPTSSGNTATQFIATGSASSPYEFVLLDDPANSASTATSFGFDTAYIADDSAIGAANGGIQKWTWNGTAWSFQYSLNDGVAGNRALAGQLDLDTGKAVLWTSSADGSKLYQVIDNGIGSAFTTLATAPTNNLFRGVALAPVPEPATIGLLSVIGTWSLKRRPRRTRRV